ncbi:uncharacterized protein LOC113351010 [Papaver somniferum]|uniref:uncharacterized protein LOC113351010 n=1 Tax=Papaver somniferum TaxID=3469 RepID=UPI000E704BF5|nr:uncharacterized protein LOC113351010 [Papaver somniferum]
MVKFQLKTNEVFWLNAVKTNEVLMEEITERDEGALKYFKDINWCRIEELKGLELQVFVLGYDSLASYCVCAKRFDSCFIVLVFVVWKFLLLTICTSQISTLAAPTALQKLRENFPRLHVYTGTIDPTVNEKRFIIPRFGDAGDRRFGT